AEAGKESAKDGELTGRVLDVAGKPVAGAKVTLWTDVGKVRAVRETGADGRFRIPVGEGPLDRGPKLIVQAKGRGADWIDVSAGPAGELSFRLGEEVPIRGQVLDLEGRPVVGARVLAREAGRSRSGDLTAYMDAWRNPGLGRLIPTLATLSPDALGVPKQTK